jgi:glycosyltransferase involved in cell wall biosynthesis
MNRNKYVSEYDVIELTNEMPVNRRGGVGSVIENLDNGFRSIGVKVLWFLLNHDYRDYEVDRIIAEFPDIAISSYTELSSYKAPILHIHTYNHEPRMIQSISDKKKVVTIHSLQICEAHSNDVDLTSSIRMQESLIAACDKVVLVSQSELNNYYKYGYHKLNPEVSVIYNGLRDSGNFRNQRDKKVIGFCGRLVPRKRPEYAQKLLTEKGFEDCSVLIAGRGFSPYARDLLQEYKLHERVHYLGWCGGDRLDSFYDSIDVLAIPSVYEPFGMIALEAVIRGIPVVCNHIDGLVEVLGDYAFYSSNNTYESFHEAMSMWLKTDKEKIMALTLGALQRYYLYFTEKIMAQNYLNLFRNLMHPN